MEAHIALPSCAETPTCFLAPCKSQEPSEQEDYLDRGRQENQPCAAYTLVYKPLGHEVCRLTGALTLLDFRVFRVSPLLRTKPEGQWLLGFRRIPFLLLVREHSDQLHLRRGQAL